MMQVRLSVEGRTYAALVEAMATAVASFLTGAPPGTTATPSQIAPAEVVDEEPAGFDPASGRVLTLPRYQLTHVYDITPGQTP